MTSVCERIVCYQGSNYTITSPRCAAGATCISTEEGGFECQCESGRAGDPEVNCEGRNLFKLPLSLPNGFAYYHTRLLSIIQEIIFKFGNISPHYL